MNNKEEIRYIIHKLDKSFKINIDNELSDHDLTYSQSQLLRHIFEHNGTLSQKEIQALMNVSHPTVVGLVKRLEAKGYVSSEVDHDDKRNRIVMTTELANNFKSDMFASKEKFDEKMFIGFDEKEISELYSMLKHMLNNIC